ncbi:hypothetical protein ABPG74_002397 [Tetrahymena malaccensis]
MDYQMIMQGAAINEQSLMQFEQLCQTTINHTDKDNLKVNEYLMNFLCNWNNWPQIQYFMQNVKNEITLFVVIEQYAKIFMNSTKFENKPMEIIIEQDKVLTGQAQIAQSLMNFFVEFFISRLDKLSNLIKNSFYHSISHLVRQNWFNMDQPAIQIIKPIIDNFFNNDIKLTKVGLKLLDEIVQSIITYSYYTSYLEYRKTMINFQRSTLHKILEVSVKELRKAFLEGYLASPVNTEAIQLMFRCMSYNFSLSFFEIEVDPEPRDLTIIAFPDKFEFLFADLDFISLLILNTFIAFKNGNSELGMIMLKTVGKIISTRQSVFLSLEVKQKFREIVFEGITTLLNLRYQERMESEYYQEVLELNFRMISNFNVSTLFSHQQLFCDWIKSLIEFQKMLIQCEKLQVRDDNILIKNVELWNKITMDLQMYGSYESQDYITDTNFNNLYINFMANEPSTLLNYKRRIEDPVKEQPTKLKIEQKDVDQIKRIAIEFFYQIFETTFKSHQVIPKDVSFKSHKSFKKQFIRFFEPYYDLFWWSQGNCIKALSIYFDEILQNYIGNVKNGQPVPEIVSEKLILALNLISNIVLNVNQVESNPYLFEESQEELFALEGQLLSYVWKLIEYSVQFNHPTFDRNLKMVELSYLVFIEQYLSITIDELEIPTDNPKSITCSRRFYRKMIKEFGIDADYNKILHISLVKMFSNTKHFDADILEYSLYLARFFFVRLKRNFSREKFKNLQCLEIVTQFIQQIDFTSLSSATFSKNRTKIYEIVALIWIDDYYDNYLQASENVYKQVKQTLVNGINRESLMKYLRDLIGLNNCIEVAKIFRFYFKHIYGDLTMIFQNMQQFFHDNEVMKVVLDFANSLTFNKTQRLNHESNSPIGYQIFQLFSTFLSQYSRYLLSKLQIQNRKVLNIEEYSKLIYKIFKILNDFLKGNYVNLSTFPMFGDSSIKDYLHSFLDLTYVVNVDFQQYPKYQESMIENLHVLTDMAIEVLFANLEIDYVSKLLEVCLMQTNIFCDLQAKTNEQQFALQLPQVTRLLDVVLNIIKYIVEEIQINCFSTPIIEQNIRNFLMSSNEIIQSLLNMFVNLILTNIKNPRLTNSSSKLLFYLYLIDTKYVELLGQHIITKLCQSIIEGQSVQQQYFTIYEGVERKLEANNEEKFVTNFKNILGNIKKQFNN